MTQRLLAAAVSASQQLAEGFEGQAMVGIWPDGSGVPVAIGLHGNPNGIATMMEAVCAIVTQNPRPTDCADCQAAYDRIAMAYLVLKKPASPSSCN